MDSSPHPTSYPAFKINLDQRLQGCIAVVDDDKGIAEAIGMWLAFEGVEYRWFESAELFEQAIEFAEQGYQLKPDRTHHRIPLIGLIIDLNLPGKNGIKVCCEVLTKQPKLCTVLISAMRQADLEKYGQVPESVTFLNKPFELSALEDALFEI